MKENQKFIAREKTQQVDEEPNTLKRNCKAKDSLSKRLDEEVRSTAAKGGLQEQANRIHREFKLATTKSYHKEGELIKSMVCDWSIETLANALMHGEAMSKGKTLQVPRDRVGKLTFDGRILASLSTGLPGHAPIRAWPVATPEDDGEDDRSGSGRAQRRRLSPEGAAVSPGRGDGD